MSCQDAGPTILTALPNGRSYVWMAYPNNGRSIRMQDLLPEWPIRMVGCTIMIAHPDGMPYNPTAHLWQK